MLLRCFIMAVLLLCITIAGNAQVIYEAEKSSISFSSDAPNEIIKAYSSKLKGIINTEKKQFAFKTEVSSMEGFNSPLQREHFNENYMESAKYPDIAFSGKIIEDVDLSKDGKYTVRAKGKLNVHGISRDRIIYANVVVKNGRVEITSEFKVALSDHDIKIPRIVNDKLATEVLVVVKTVMLPYTP